MNKKHLLSIVCLAASVVLGSWGMVGHQTVGVIASHHLTPKAKAAVKDLLGNESLAQVSTWADEVKSDPDYRHTSPWHYLDLPLGLTYDQFADTVKRQQQDNVYKAVLQCEATLKSESATRNQKVEALKFLVHFIGDLHQPMHVSRTEDKGGNDIQVNYKGKGSNLHAVWDTKLIEDQSKSDSVLAAMYDHATSEQIKKWQSESLMQWLWESYQQSTKLYAEIDAMKTRSLKDDYYQKHISTVAERIDMAGIRLAGVLNEIFGEQYKAPAKDANEPKAIAPVVISLNDIASHMNEVVTVTGKIADYKALSGMTLVNLGASYPDQLLTVVLKGEALDANPKLKMVTVTVTGKLIDYKGKPEIMVSNPANFQVINKK